MEVDIKHVKPSILCSGKVWSVVLLLWKTKIKYDIDALKRGNVILTF